MATSLATPRIHGRLFLSLFLLALAVRVGAAAAAGLWTTRFGDSAAYRFAARELLRNGRYPLATEPFYFRAPGYPVFLALATLGHPDSIPAGKVANAILGALSVPLLAAISARVFRRSRVALATGVAAAIHPGFVFLSTDIQSEPLFLLLLLVAGFFLLSAVDRPSSNLAVAAGIAVALAALTRPSVLALAPLLASPLLDRRYPVRARAHLAASALAGFLVALAPWTLRNALVFHEVLLVNDAAGSAFYQGNSDWTVRFYELETPDEYRAWSRAMFSDLERRTREIDRASGGSPGARSRELVREAVAERWRDAAGWARLLARKAWDWARPYPSPLFWGRGVVWATGFFYTTLTALAAWGLAAAPRPGVRAFALAVLVISLAAHVVFIVVWRYRVPYWDPILLLYGVFGGDTLLSRWRRQRS